ncbi:Ig-like domain-containing protein, partial [Paraglaciecola hydrolytica]
KEKPQHFFYENMGDGTFNFKSVAGIQDAHPSRALITDINNDHIDDVILYGPLSVWLGNGDFTFTEVTSQFPKAVTELNNIMAIADIDMDNDGDLDLYLARGKEFEFGLGETPSMDFDPIAKTFSIKPRGFKGVDEFEFTAEGDIHFYNYYFLAQGEFRGKDYPLFLGSNKDATVLANNQELTISPAQAQGWPDDISQNGMYFGHIGKGKWKAALVRNGNIFWGFKFSLNGVNSVTPKFTPQNRNEADVLLRNDDGKFTDVSQQWNIPSGGNALGVTVGDFNNDSHQDLFVYRWGFIQGRSSDYMLLNNGKGQFETVTMHGANDVGGPGNGDMGQAFDFDLDGDIDLLNGSEGGQWYLYANQLFNQPTNQPSEQKNQQGNYALVKVGYGPKTHIDAISAQVILKTAKHTYRKRVGSAGEIFSQSLLNIVHFGLGEQEKIDSIEVRWRNGETIIIKDKTVNALFDTDKVDPVSLKLEPAMLKLRRGSSVQLDAAILPANADKKLIWSSSNDAVLKVDQQGVVTALGEAKDTAFITATSEANGLPASTKVSIENWYPIQLETVKIAAPATELFSGQSLDLSVTEMPQQADDVSLVWSSSEPNIATVDAKGRVTALTSGEVIIRAQSQVYPAIADEVKLNIKAFIKPYIKITNADELANGALVVGQNITLNVEYHAGTGHKVIASDEGGIRFWFRHFKYEWIPEKDTVLVDASALKTESGSSSMTFLLEGLTPTAELPEGQFYYLRASFTSSDGNNYDSAIYPINIVAKK